MPVTKYDTLFFIITKNQDEWHHKLYMPKNDNYFEKQIDIINNEKEKNVNLLILKYLNVKDLNSNNDILNTICTFIKSKLPSTIDFYIVNIYILHHVESIEKDRIKLNEKLKDQIEKLGIQKDKLHIHPYTVGSAGDEETFTSNYLFKELNIENVTNYISVLKGRLKVNEFKEAIEKEYLFLSGTSTNFTNLTYDFK